MVIHHLPPNCCGLQLDKCESDGYLVPLHTIGHGSKVGVYVRNSDGMFWSLYIIMVPGFSEAPAGLVRI